MSEERGIFTLNFNVCEFVVEESIPAFPITMQISLATATYGKPKEKSISIKFRSKVPPKEYSFTENEMTTLSGFYLAICDKVSGMPEDRHFLIFADYEGSPADFNGFVCSDAHLHQLARHPGNMIIVTISDSVFNRISVYRNRRHCLLKS